MNSRKDSRHVRSASVAAPGECACRSAQEAQLVTRRIRIESALIGRCRVASSRVRSSSHGLNGEPSGAKVDPIDRRLEPARLSAPVVNPLNNPNSRQLAERAGHLVLRHAERLGQAPRTHRQLDDTATWLPHRRQRLQHTPGGRPDHLPGRSRGQHIDDQQPGFRPHQRRPTWRRSTPATPASGPATTGRSGSTADLPIRPTADRRQPRRRPGTG